MDQRGAVRGGPGVDGGDHGGDHVRLQGRVEEEGGAGGDGVEWLRGGEAAAGEIIEARLLRPDHRVLQPQRPWAPSFLHQRQSLLGRRQRVGHAQYLHLYRREQHYRVGTAFHVRVYQYNIRAQFKPSMASG